MDKSLVTGSVFIDLAKAFDTVDHDILLRKLEYYGICNESLPWFKNYFTGRKQFVHIDSQSSEELAITSGVPQGSILGPLLFIVYINDLPRCVKHCSVNMYADDIVLYIASQTVENLPFTLTKIFSVYLNGVMFDNNMTWKAHVDYVFKKVASRVSILGRIRSFVTKEAAALVHNALILPLFDYCDIFTTIPQGK
ncbi:uncharacterized protein LOC111347263, partial [Stylophora pistillata]|uniref:uncharacterized protein LOC111347263 n=1 Tax=Stylophora pistillata TaxID=50429 RepID=UPI000C04E337